MRIVMMGTGTFAEPTLEALLAGPHQMVGLVTQPDRAVGQERGSTRQTGRGMKTIAQERGVPVFQPERINTPEGVEGLRKWQPDLLVVAAYGQILSNDVLAIPERGGINVHASLLPKYRGAAPIAWAIYHGETQTGVTIIQMSTRLDAGNMLAQQAIDIGPDETAGELEARLAPLGARLALQTIQEIELGRTKSLPQDASLVSKAPKLTKEHGLLDWTRPAQAVCNQIRAMQPWPTAYTFWQQQGKPPLRLMILKARPSEKQTLPDAIFGQVVPVRDSPHVLHVAAGDGRLVEILEVQPAGKRRMATADFLRGHPALPGDFLGNG
ncbi:MAG: methionyl-tRNA formyltransferase [Gemmataceae bacterium]